ncbi:hypothetical protein [Bifidobacterium callitrichidarum]|uniref:Uncharacterized protein n=1 Tax=Bifidobacterium callitrichidarum TaxID=2052941 RepID=A0A2U2MYI4_9BIFI|nr:hypothetical protein [Bifidobacterium callitrichidarum]PWG62075.1 hypothetical protein DF196_12675 [Bifidobacterium callitrichidarum]
MKGKLQKAACIAGIIIAAIVLADLNLPQDVTPNIPGREPVTTEETISMRSQDHPTSEKVLES